jgi:prophage regulatory protein
MGSELGAPEVSNEPTQMDVPRRMLNLEKVLALIPVSRTTLFRMEREGRFPKSHYVSPNRRLWYEDDIIAWQDALPTNRRIRTARQRRQEVIRSD